MKKRKDVYVDNRGSRARKVSKQASKRRQGNKILLTVLVLLVGAAVIATSLYLLKEFKDPNGGGKSSADSSLSDKSQISSSKSNSQDTSGDPTDSSQDGSQGASGNDSQDSQSPTKTPDPTPTTGFPNTGSGASLDFGKVNPILMNEYFRGGLTLGTIFDPVKPSNVNLSSVIYKGTQVLSSYNRENPLAFGNPANYADVPGVLTFRGNNFRNAPAFGLVEMKEKTLEQIWERSVGGMRSSAWSWSWSGTGWTGQPVMVQWDDDVKEMMNIYPEKKSKPHLVEVISTTMDGNIYFYDLEDGQATRPPIHIGVVVKGTPAIDPRGYPILYVGQGDNAPKGTSQKMGVRIFNLLDQSLMHFLHTGAETRSHRNSWGASDSSPIVDKNSDTLIFPCENGMIYTAKLNTVFDKKAKTISIKPEFIDYKYRSDATRSQGIESSMSVYGGYGYFADNSGTLNCVDLNTMTPVWSKKMDDDSDVTPMLQVEGDRLYVYCGTEVDDQKPIKGVYKGEAYIYKFDALTGETVWRNSYAAYTYNDPGDPGNDINGGIMGSFTIGKGRHSNKLIVSVCMTEGYMSGNTLAALDTQTGELIWTYKMNHYTWGSPVDVYDSKGKMYLLITDSVSQIHLVDGDTGERLHFIQVKRGFDKAEPVSGGNIESSAAVFGDILVIGTRGGVLAGVRLR